MYSFGWRSNNELYDIMQCNFATPVIVLVWSSDSIAVLHFVMHDAQLSFQVKSILLCVYCLRTFMAYVQIFMVYEKGTYYF